MIPNDPVMLLSFVNTKLRDYYNSLGEMCGDLELDPEALKAKLAAIDYRYDEERNRFV